MIGYKGFNKKLQCTLGKGVFQYEVGKTYEEEEANCARNGFHFVEEPIRVLDWYEDGRWCMVDAQDVHEDGTDKAAAKKMTIIKELTLKQLIAHEAAWIMKHPERKYSKRVIRGKGKAKENGAIIIRGKNPKGQGELGSLIVLVKEAKESCYVERIVVIEIDGKKRKPGVWYGTEDEM